MNGTVSPLEVQTDQSSASSLRRALAMLSWIAAQQRPCGVREIAAATSINKSSVHRFLDAMRREGWIVQDPATEKYRLGPVPVEIGLAALATLEFRAVARPLLETMAERTGETSYLGVLLGSDVVYVDVVLGGHAIVAKRDIGARLPAYRTAIGKVLLANLSRDQLMAILLATAPNSSPERLEGELAEIRRLSIALNDEESAPGVFSLASPLRDFNGHVVAGIGIGGPKTRLLPRLKEYSDLVKQVALAASQSLGYHSSIPGS